MTGAHFSHVTKSTTMSSGWCLYITSEVYAPSFPLPPHDYKMIPPASAIISSFQEEGRRAKAVQVTCRLG